MITLLDLNSCQIYFLLFRLTAETLKQLQTKERISPRNRRIGGSGGISRRLGTFSEREDLDVTIEEMENMLGLTSDNHHGETGDKRLAAQVNAVAVLDMIKNLQDEIKVG